MANLVGSEIISDVHLLAFKNAARARQLLTPLLKHLINAPWSKTETLYLR